MIDEAKNNKLWSENYICKNWMCTRKSA